MSEKQNITMVSSSESVVCRDSREVVSTYLEGTGTAVTFYDSDSRVGGLLHYLFPSFAKSGDKGTSSYSFADTGIEKILFMLIDNGAAWDQLTIKLCGALISGTDTKEDLISKRNILAARKVFWRLGLFIQSQDVGGSLPRDLYFDMSNGAAKVTTSISEKNI